MKRADKGEPRKPNISEVAKRADVSVATVSRYLRSPNVVAPATQARVQKAIADLAYTPNAQARGLRTAKSGLVVALVPNIANPFFAEVIRGIELVAYQNGYSVLLGDVRGSELRQSTYVNLVSARQADGLISLMPRIPDIRTNDKIPVVSSCTFTGDKTLACVYVDNCAAAQGATEYLLSLGHTAIGFIRGVADSPNSTQREAGYRAGLKGAKIKAHASWVAPGDFTVNSGYRGALSLVERNPELTALFCANDEMALGAIRAVKERGMRIPDDISIIGFDGISFSQFFDPPLTTVAMPMQQLGEESMLLLLDMLNDAQSSVRQLQLPTSLIVRQSTGRPPKR